MRTFPAVRQMEDLCMNSGKNLTYVVFRNGTIQAFILVLRLSILFHRRLGTFNFL